MRKLVLLCFCLAIGVVIGQENPKLVMLLELFRHGVRTPFIDPLRTKWINEFGFGELTPTGIREHFVLGQQIRSRYKDFLPETYNADWLTVYSTHNNRTIESAFAQLDGLFYEGGPDLPPGFTPETNYTQPPITITVPLSDFSDAALPYHFVDIAVSSNVADRDLILETSTTCPRLMEIVKDDAANSESFEEAHDFLINSINTMADLLHFQNDHDGDLTIHDGGQMADYMLCSLWNDEQIPIDYPDPLFQTADYLLALDMYFEFESHSNAATFATGMAQHFLEDLQKKVEEPESATKLVMYSGHDTNVANILALFNLTNYSCTIEYMNKNKPFDENCIGNPPFASSAFFELYQDSESDFFVKFQVNEVYYSICDAQSNEEEFCPWDQFATLLNSSIVANFDEVCHDYIFKYKMEGIKGYIIPIVALSGTACFTFLLIFVAGITACCLFSSKKKEEPIIV